MRKSEQIRAVMKSNPQLKFCERFDDKSNIWQLLRHKHPYIEVLFFLDGKATIMVNDTKLSISIYDTVVYPRNVYHQEFLPSGQRQEVICCWIDIPELILDAPVYVQDRDGKLKWLFENIAKEFHNPDMMQEMLDCYMKLILLFVLRNKELGPARTLELHRAMQYIHGHFTEDITGQDLAELEHISESYLSRRFKQINGISVVKYINKLRVEAAKQLLITSQRDISEISYLVGYHSPKYFCRIFKMYTGVSPTVFRMDYYSRWK